MKNLIVALLILSLLPFYTSAQSWQELYHSIDSLQENGDWEQVVEILEKAKVLAEKEFGRQDSSYAVTVHVLALGYDYLADYPRSEKLYLEALQIRQAIFPPNHPEIAETLNNLALVYETTGRYAEAEPMYLQSMEIRRQTLGEMHPDFANSLNNLAWLYDVTGRYEEAERLYLQVVNILKETLGEDHLYQAYTLNNLALLYEITDRYEEAEELHLKSIAIRKQTLGEQDPEYATALSNLARLYDATARYAEAESLYLQAMEIEKQTLGEEHPSYATSLINIAALYQAWQPENPQIETLCQQAIAIDKAVFGTDSEYVMGDRQNLARFYYLSGEKGKAVPVLKEGLDYYRKQVENRFEYLGEQEREAIYNLVKPTFEAFIDLAFREQKDYPELLIEACNLQLQHKAILLSTSNLIKSRILDSGDQKLITLFQEVEALRQELGQINSLPAEVRAEMEPVADSLRKILHVKDQQLTQSSTFYKAAREPITWQTIRDRLGKKEAFVEIVRFREFDYRLQKIINKVNYGAFIITSKTKSRPEVVRFPDGNFLEEKAIKAYQTFVRFQLEDNLSYASFWEPLKKALKKVKTVYFSPDGVFNQLNLQTLYHQKKDRFLFEEVDLRLLTSGKELAYNPQIGQDNDLALLIGNPAFEEETELSAEITKDFSLILNTTERKRGLLSLPGAETEIEKISELLGTKGWHHQKWVGAMAKESALKSMPNPKVLHIATHGFFQEEKDGNLNYRNNPLYRSGLLLTGAAKTLNSQVYARDNVALGKEDGILTAFEAKSLDLNNTDLVVLSACETGLGEIRNGEGVYGLQRAFKVAGARSILMSLWKVNDQTTQELMVSFYKNWLEGNMSKREAFRQAQNEIKARYPHPYYWGAFVMIGE